MGRPPMHGSSSQLRACLNCQKRKSRCQPSLNGPGPCSYCARAGKDCSFVNPPDRTRLTRKNLDAMEQRCNKLESLIRSLHPDMDIDVALANLEAGQEAIRRTEQESDDESPEHEEPAHEYEWSEPSLPPDFDSQNDEAGAMDGMATLNSLDAGYLGSSSGANLLQEIASMLPELAASNSPANSHGKSPSRTHKSKASLDPPNLANESLTSYLIDAYFLFYNVSYPILHERSFRQKLAARGMRRGKSSWNIIYYLVLAIGHWISTSDKHHAGSRFYTAARNSLSIHMLESGSLETVQALLLMGNYLQKMDKPNTGYQFIGIAYKMALGLGMHRETPNLEDNIGLERRRQLFWVVYCFDSGFNITTGRPPYAQEGIIDTALPRNIDDKDLEPSMLAPPEVNTPTTLSAVIAQAELAKHANSLYLEYLTAKTANTKVEYQVAEAIERTLTDWRHKLPQYFTSVDVPIWFTGPRAVVLWKEQNLRIILWRGSKRNHPYLPSKTDAETRCLDAAMQSINDITAFCSVNEGILHLGIVWYATYFLFQAALVLEASYLDREAQNKLDNETTDWRMMVHKAQSCLVTFSSRSRSSKRCLEVLELINRRAETAANTRRTVLTVPELVEEAPTALQAPVGDTETSIPPVDLHNFSDGDLSMGAWTLNDDGSDPTMRMILDNTPWGYLDNAPMDALFNDWFPQDTFDG
ncbi:fungal-specific transcription factor domain-containing protein [Fusarium redolens]|uniref:Fungal-specific transcription factor domain-containing protein n=1 Tax=Fusarium redolens TaxID=48865 RepID=A0A9P9KEC8_FUSRE|nr:fungal-specific transcription factor domain-containing protein [Fusarium redolens]KAH7259407.1 fungal-specific transcription factor domain-containing protein [Fusarium redolens]